MGSTFRMVGWIADILREAEEPMTIEQICDIINSRQRHGVTMNQLVNVVGKRKQFREVGQIKIGYNRFPTYVLVEEE